MSKYKIIFSLENKLYFDGAPILIESGALVVNTENEKIHIQLKFKNLSKANISMVKVGFVLMDSVGREIGRGDKQYLDLNAKLNESFGDKIPAYLKDNTVRKFSVTVNEVCFADGDIWAAPENALWEKIPAAQPLSYKLSSEEAQEEFRLVHCKEARFAPFTYKDVWICACGNVNKHFFEKCCACDANYSDMESVDEETLKNDGIYSNATALLDKNVSFEIEKAIALFESIKAWRDSDQKIEEAKQKLIVISQNLKTKKRNIIIAALSGLAVIALSVGIIVSNSISKANKYEQAKELMAQNNLSTYGKAMELLNELKGYKNADELYTRAKYMHEGNYKSIIEMDDLWTFVIPDDVTSIAPSAFYDCESLRGITIPDGVTSIGEGAFSSCSNLWSITIPDSVTSIGEGAFSSCSNLTSVYITDIVAWCNISFGDYEANPLAEDLYLNNKLVTELIIPDSVTSIGAYAFSGCDGLTSITIPDSVTSIGAYTFSDCYGLTSITIPDSVTSIGEGAFFNCRNLTSITIPDGVTSIGEKAFYYCSNLTSITIPDGVTSIGEEAFSYCSRLRNITIPDSVTSIGEEAFSCCSNLWNITIPDSVTSIGKSAFLSCSNLISVYITDIVAWCNISFGDDDANPLCQAKNLYLNNKLVTELIIPDGVTSIGAYAFSGCDGLTSITIPDSVTSIGKSAFLSCSNLTSVYITDIVAWCNISFGDYEANPLAEDLYLDNKLVTELIIPDSVTSIGAYAFSGCDGLTSITIPDSVTSIGAYTFSDCYGLTSITIPDSVTSIGEYAFNDCFRLTVYCEAAFKPSGWSDYWDYSVYWNQPADCYIVWGYKEEE